MATSNKNILSPELKELVVNNIQDVFPAIVDKNIIHRVLKNENWDIEKAFHILEKLHHELSNNKNEIENSKFQKAGSSQTVQESLLKSEKVKKKEKPFKNKNNSEMKKVPSVVGASMKSQQKENTAKETKVKQQRQNEQKQENITTKNKFKKDIKRLYESIKQMKDPFERIVNYGKSRIKVMVFMRGCPGSGKSTYAKEVLHSIGVADPAWFMFSADDFFVDQSTGKYIYNRELIQSAHLWNQKLVRQAASEGRSPLIIDNTHTKLWEMQDNAKVGVEYSYIIETLEPKTPWFFIEAELCRKTTHSVSRETIQRMIDRYEPNLTGLDVIHLTGLTYIRPPPVRQIAELNTPPSKKCMRLVENKVVINNDEQFTFFDQKAYTEKNVFLKCNRTNQSNSPHFADQTSLSQGQQRMFLGTKSQNRKYEAMPKFQTNVMKGQQTTADRNPCYQNETSGSNGIFPFYNILSIPFPESHSSRWNESTSFWQESTSGTNAQLNDDKNSNVISPFNENNVATTYDLIDLSHNDIQPLIPSNSQNIPNSSEPSPYKPDFPNYFNLSHEVSSSDEGPVDSDDDDEDDEEEEDDDHDEEETDEDLLEFDSLNDIRKSVDSPCTAVSSELVTNKEKIINSCKEYVLVMPDETLLFEKEHKNFPTNLNDFKKCCAIEEEEEEKENKEAKPENMLNSNLSNNLIGYEFVLIKPDLTVIYQKSHADEPGTLKEFLDKSQKNNNEVGNLEENKSNNNPVINDKACNVNINVDSNSVSLVNKSISTEHSAADESLYLAEPKNVKRFMEASSNTIYMDFEVLKQINTIDGGGDFRNDVITGRPIFESGPFIDNNHKHAQSTVLMLDKSSMTCDIQTNHINNADFGVNSLVQMFPTIKRENLEELLNKCGKDLDWAVGLLLDSGHEMSEFLPVMEQPQNSEINNMFDNDCDVVNLDFDSNNSIAITSNSTASNKIINERKKKKKNHASLTDSSLDLIQNFQDKFKLNDECYSENIMKIRKHRMVNTDEPMKNTSKCECRPMEMNDAPETLEEEDCVEEEEEFAGEEEDEGDSDVGLVVDKNLVIQLQNKFGGLMSPNLIGDKTILHIPKSLARQLYCYTFDAVYEHLEQQQSVIDMLITEGNGIDTQEDERLKSQPSFQEIMDHEIAVRMSQVKDNNRANTAASALSRTLLMERFPNFDPSTLTSILEETNHSLHAATNLLTFAGHPMNIEESPEQESTKQEENSPLTREEAIQQAHAYSDVAGKLCEMREDCLKKAENALAERKKTVAQYYSEMAKWYMERIEQSNSLAANAMLIGHEGATTLDLHFLQVHQALKVLDLFLDDKIRTLMNKRKITVYIITGRGSHSPKGLCKIKHVVQIRLRKRHIPYTEQNPGMLRAYITKRAIISYKKMVT